RRLAGLPEPAPLWIVAGRGSFGRQVAGGAQAGAARLGIEVVRSTQAGYLSQVKGAAHDLLCAGSFEEDVELLSRLEHRPRTTWAVAAGVRRFGSALDAPGGVYGPAQWLPGTTPRPDVGPPELGFVREYAEVAGEPPDYPAAQAAATAALATLCLELAGTSTAPDLWRAAAGLNATTFYGRFRVDHRSGAQLGHEVVLVRWAQDRRLGPA
ncbi:MAG: ABC transporter substrate-binding protein, partial [Candidatus Dormibacteraeota bacterium]|nr:ABC transporter substrate-binding protein [Candidatus Dormibacteraeota bacterium]